MPLTDFFVRRPCISILTPYFLLIIFAVIAFAGGMFNLNFENDDASLVNSDPIVIDRDIVRLANKQLNRDQAKIDELKEKAVENQVRYESKPPILIIYENKNTEKTGLLTKKTIM